METEKENAIIGINKLIIDYNLTCKKGNEINIITLNKNAEDIKITKSINEELIKKLINRKITESDLLQNPRNKKTRMIVESKMREMYHFGWNNCIKANESFTRKEIETLQSEVYSITGKGEVMQKFNKLLGVNEA